jgi:hypothetical protein
LSHHPTTGRSRNRGEKNGNAKLTDQQVRQIWDQYHQLAMTRITLAQLYRVSTYAIHYALNVRGPALGLRRPTMDGGESA